jgi:GNAT superfamily N-acetyltransferase
MIRPCREDDFETIHTIINAAAQAYRGVIPEDCWHEPYMSRDELRHEMDAGVVFWGYAQVGRTFRSASHLVERASGELVGVMGIQHVQDVTLIRHAYVRPARQDQGIGGQLLSHLRKQTTRPILIGTWADGAWAIRFYQKHGFRLVSPQDKARLLRRYWSIPERQVETSVVLADERWFGAADD